MTRKSNARRRRDKSGYTVAAQRVKLTHTEMETHAIKVLGKLRPALSYPELVRWVTSMSEAERAKMSEQILAELPKSIALKTRALGVLRPK